MEITLEVDTWFGKQEFVIKIVALKYLHHYYSFILSFHILGSQKSETSNTYIELANEIFGPERGY